MTTHYMDTSHYMDTLRELGKVESKVYLCLLDLATLSCWLPVDVASRQAAVSYSVKHPDPLVAL